VLTSVPPQSRNDYPPQSQWARPAYGYPPMQQQQPYYGGGYKGYPNKRAYKKAKARRHRGRDAAMAASAGAAINNC